MRLQGEKKLGAFKVLGKHERIEHGIFDPFSTKQAHFNYQTQQSCPYTCCALLSTVPGTQACSSVRQFHFYGEAKDVTGAKLVTSLFPNPVNLCTFILSLQGESKMIIMGNELIQGHVDA